MIALFFDTETTGIKTWDNPDFVPRLVQLGAILQDTESGRVLSEVNFMIHPGDTQIPPDAARIHGITTELATEYGIPVEAVDRIFENMIDKAQLIVAHNIGYDLDVVKDNLPRCHELINKRPHFCTMQANVYIVNSPLSDKQFSYFRAHPEKQDALYKVPTLTETFKHYYGRAFEGAHDAMADIRACRDIYLDLIERGHYTVDENLDHAPNSTLLAEIEDFESKRYKKPGKMETQSFLDDMREQRVSGRRKK